MCLLSHFCTFFSLIFSSVASYSFHPLFLNPLFSLPYLYTSVFYIFAPYLFISLYLFLSPSVPFVFFLSFCCLSLSLPIDSPIPSHSLAAPALHSPTPSSLPFFSPHHCLSQPDMSLLPFSSLFLHPSLRLLRHYCYISPPALRPFYTILYVSIYCPSRLLRLSPSSVACISLLLSPPSFPYLPSASLTTTPSPPERIPLPPDKDHVCPSVRSSRSLR